jgi:predicted exporter
VGLLFWLLHRRIRPLFYLMLAMLVTGLLTLGVAGLTFGALDVMSMGFAAILMGMIEDFGVLGLHEAMRRPGAGFRAIHASVLPSIAWSALTSAAVFAALGLSTLPGIARMGLLTALGIIIGAAVMLYGFLPLAMRRSGTHPVALTNTDSRRTTSWPGWLALLLTLCCVGSLVLRGLPGVDNNTGVLRPRHCKAFAALLDLQKQLQPDQANTLWLPLIIHAQSATQLAASLRQLETRLTNAKAYGRTLGHLLPSTFAPDPARQRANLPVLTRLAAAQDRLLHAMDQAGFTAEGMAYSRSILEIWAQWGRDQPPPTTRWPAADVLENLIGPVLRRDAEGIMACGFVLLPKSTDLFQSNIIAEIQQDAGVKAGGFDYLTSQLKSLLHSEVKRVLLPAAAVLGIFFFLVFRNARERLVAVGSLVFSAMLLLGTMSATGMAWNFVNIGAVPLSLGLGLDFNIHMIHALRERGADGHGIGRALAYCGLSTGLGFGALGLSDNSGLASFGQTSMIGVLATLLTAAFFVPWAWHRLTTKA